MALKKSRYSLLSVYITCPAAREYSITQKHTKPDPTLIHIHITVSDVI